MTLQLGGGGAITGCTSLADPVLTLDGLVVGGTGRFEDTVTIGGTVLAPNITLDATGQLTVGDGTGSHTIEINGIASSTSIGQLLFSGGGTNNPSAQIEYDASDRGLAFQVGNLSDLSTSERMRIDSSGNVGINSSDPTGDGWSAANDLVINSTGNSGMTIKSGTSSFGQLVFNDAAGGLRGFVAYGHTEDYLGFGTSGAEGLRIDSAGRLLLGTTTEGVSGGDQFTIGVTGNNNAGMTIRSGTSTRGAIYFSDGTSGTAEYQGFIEYQQGAGGSAFMRFGTDAIERMRIDSSGRVLVGLNTAPTVGAQAPYAKLSVFGNTFDTTAAGYLNLGRNDAVTNITNGQGIGGLIFPSVEGNQYAKIECFADGASSATASSGKLIFYTTPNATTAPVQRLTIYRNGITVFNNAQSAIQLNTRVFTGNNAYQNITSWSNAANLSGGGSILVLLHNHTGTVGGKPGIYMIYVNFNGELGGTVAIEANGLSFDAQVSGGELQFKAFDGGTGLSTTMGYSLIYSDARLHTSD